MSDETSCEREPTVDVIKAIQFGHLVDEASKIALDDLTNRAGTAGGGLRARSQLGWV